MAPSTTMKASPHGEGVQVGSSSGASGPVSEMHGVFTNTNLSSTSGAHPRATTIVCMLLESSRQPWPTTQKRANCVWYEGFC